MLLDQENHDGQIKTDSAAILMAVGGSQFTLDLQLMEFTVILEPVIDGFHALFRLGTPAAALPVGTAACRRGFSAMNATTDHEKQKPQ